MNNEPTKTCSNCMFWGAESSKRWAGTLWENLRDCSYAEPDWENVKYDRDANRDVVTSGRLAFVSDGSDYMAVLKTRPEFGCNQFVPKEA